MVGPGRPELEAAMGAPSVVVGLVLGQAQQQMPFAEDQHPIGNFGPGDGHEPFRVSVASHRQRHSVRMIGTGVCG